MPQKFIHGVSPELTDDAAYKTFASIEAHALTPGTTVRFYPGVHEMGSVTLDNIILEGTGAKESVVLANANAFMANTVVFRGLTLSGNSPAAASSAASIFITNSTNAQAQVKFEEVNFTRGDFGVDNQGLPFLTFTRCDFSGVDRAIKSNSVVSANVNMCLLNLNGNAYFTGANATVKTVTVRGSYGGTCSNVGNTVETVVAAVS